MVKFGNKDINYIKSLFHINDVYARKFLFILNKKDRENISKELDYFRSIYQEPDYIIIQCLINKYLKIKLYNRKFININTKVNAHCEILLLIQECDIIFKNYGEN